MALAASAIIPPSRFPDPVELENRLENWENRLVEFLGRQSPLFTLPAAMLLSLAFFYLSVALKRGPEHELGTFRVLQYSRHWLPFLPMLGLAALACPRRLQSALLYTCASLGWIIPLHLISSAFQTTASKLLFASVGPAIMGLTWIFFRYLPKVKRRLPWITAYVVTSSALLLTQMLALNSDSGSAHDASSIWRMSLVSVVVFALATVFRHGSAKNLENLAINPFHGVRGILWPASYRFLPDLTAGKIRNWWRGAFNLALAAALIAGADLAHNWILQSRGLPFLVMLSANVYVFFFRDIAFFNVVSGVSRIFGYAVPDATRYLLLARNPRERWRKGNVYNYAFNMEFIYFPMVRLWHHAMPAALIVFLKFFISHFGLSAITGTFYLLSGHGLEHGSYERSQVVYSWTVWSLWFLAILWSRESWPLGIRAKKHGTLSAWLSVGLTHLLAIMIQAAAFFAMSKLR